MGKIIENLFKKSIFVGCFFSAISIAVLSSAAWADGWRASFANYQGIPSTLLTVDKSKQGLFLLKKHSPIKLVKSYTCSTGQVQGDKQEEGDLKTPEGIYFLERKLQKGLDYELYGDRAFTLNFPNPVDRIRFKGGYGIWLHGRGIKLKPRDTKGCIALSGDDIMELSQEIELALTPIAIAKETEFFEEDPTTADQVQVLRDKVNHWLDSWRSMDETYFTFYDPQKYALSTGKSFDYFKAYKKALFDQYPWIDVYAGDIAILAGPDYWVTYFEQLYRTPTFLSQGIKRLYWQESQNNGLQIVGMEWVPYKGSIKSEYTKAMQASIEEMLSTWVDAWLETDLEMYTSLYAPEAIQESRKGKQSIQEYKHVLWQRVKPKDLKLENIQVDFHPEGARVVFLQHYKDEKGFSDKGMKHLILKRVGNSWLISHEQWRPLL